MQVTATNGRVRFNLRATVRGDIMKLESTDKTKAFGVPEYMTIFHNTEISKCYGANGWTVRVNK